MFTRSILNKKLKVSVSALLLVLITAPVFAQQVEDSESQQTNLEIDRFMGTLYGPNWQLVWVTPEDAPNFPIGIYKQQPPGAQGDFNPPEEVVDMVDPSSTTTSSSSGSGSGSGSPPPSCPFSICI